MKKRKKKKINVILLIIFGLILLLGIFLIFNKTFLTGKVIEEQNEFYEENLNLVFNENSEFNWTPIENGEITSIKIYGEYEEGGEIEIIFENLSLYKVEKKSVGLTGQVIEGEKKLNESKIVIFFKKIFGRISGQVTEGMDSDSKESSTTESEKPVKKEKEIKKDEPQKEKQDSEEKKETPKEEKKEKTLTETEPTPPTTESEQTPIETTKEPTPHETVEETTRVEPPTETQGEIPPEITSEQTPTDTTQENITEEISITQEINETSNETQIIENENITIEASESSSQTINIIKENITPLFNETSNESILINFTNETGIKKSNESFSTNKIQFENQCIETCNILLEKKDSYRLKIILKNSNLTIHKIRYSIKKTNLTQEIILVENITEETFHSEAKLGEPVNWTKKINVSEEGKIKLELPKIAKNINVISINESINVSENETKEVTIEKNIKFTISENVVSQTKKPTKNIFSSLTGNVVSTEQENIELIIEENGTRFEIKYQTDAPTSTEEILTNGKKIKIIGPEEVHYNNILAFTELNESLKIVNETKINIFWIENKTNIENFHLIDKNNNSIYDYIEWIVPNLSSQTFEIIVITKAEHLNESRIFIEDIYESVKELDDSWSKTIKQNEYVRVNFEKKLTNKNDITIYPRIISGNPKIEIYEINKDKKIAEFGNIISDEYNKVYLTNLENIESAFDLKIIDGEIIFNHIVDPTNYTSQTCTGLWGFDCGVGPPEAGDNTFDSCSTGLGGDESVEQIYLNATAIIPGEALKVTCEFDPYTSNDDTFIWYYNTTNWIKLFEHKNWGSASITNESVTFIPNNSIGTHLIRCGIIYITNSDLDECMNTGSFYDNDDINFSIINPNNSPSIPTNITCDNINCNITINTGTTIKSSGSIDLENDNLTYFIEALLNKFLNFLHISQTSLKIPTLQRNISSKNCLQQWGFDCGTGPIETGGDNTFDSCNSGSGADESVENIYINSTKIFYGDTISVICNFDPYRSSDDTYIWYYNGTGWKKLFEHINWGSNKLVNESTSFKPDNIIGTHWIRCGIGYYTDTDYCQDTTNYFDNDDISFEVISPIDKDKNTSKKYFNELGNNQTNLTKIELIFEIDSYNPSASALNSNSKPDLFLEIFNGTNFTSFGNLNLPLTYTSSVLETTNKNFTKIISNSTILNAWKNKTNQNISLTGIYFDSGDEINFTNIWINFIYADWTTIGNHTQNSSLFWNTTNLPEENCINLRSKSIDLLGSNFPSPYFYKNSCLNISHEYIENTPPIIEKIYTEEMTDVSGGLNEGPLSTEINIKFLVYDSNGYSDLIDSTATITFSKINEEERKGNCSRIELESNGNYANYSCNIIMWWFDGPGTWNILGEIKDSINNTGQNNSNTFLVGATSGFTSSPNFISWEELFPGAINKEALEPIILNNTGNVPKNIEINSSNLYGQIDESKIIYANNFSVGNSLGCNGTLMEKNTFIILLNTTLSTGNYTLNDGTGQEQLYFCLKKAGEDLTSQNYTTSKSPWTIRIF